MSVSESTMTPELGKKNEDVKQENYFKKATRDIASRNESTTQNDSKDPLGQITTDLSERAMNMYMKLLQEGFNRASKSLKSTMDMSSPKSSSSDPKWTLQSVDMSELPTLGGANRGKEPELAALGKAADAVGASSVAKSAESDETNTALKIGKTVSGVF